MIISRWIMWKRYVPLVEKWEMRKQNWLESVKGRVLSEGLGLARSEDNIEMLS
jgi:hypothetical protein